MDSRRPPEYSLELSADRTSVKDVVKGMLQCNNRLYAPVTDRPRHPPHSLLPPLLHSPPTSHPRRPRHNPPLRLRRRHRNPHRPTDQCLHPPARLRLSPTITTIPTQSRARPTSSPIPREEAPERLVRRQSRRGDSVGELAYRRYVDICTE